MRRCQNRDEPVFRHHHAAARARAESLGYGLEVHWARDPAIPPARLDEILLARGVPGLLIAPFPHGAPPLALDWSRYAAVALGHTFKQVPVHRVTNNQFHTIMLALEACHARGHRRVGLALPAFSDARVDHLWLAGFLTYQSTHPGAGKVPPLIVNPLRRDDFVAWFRRERPEVVLTTDASVLAWLRELDLRIPDDVACVHLDWTPERGDIAAVDQRPGPTGEAAVDLLVEQINQNRRGPPSFTHTVLIESVWRDGPTLPFLPARRRRAPADAPSPADACR